MNKNWRTDWQNLPNILFIRKLVRKRSTLIDTFAMWFRMKEFTNTILIQGWLR